MAVKASSQISMIDVTDAYSVLLTSEAYAFTGNVSGAPEGLTCTTQVVAFCGQKSCTSLNVSNISCPTGITATVSNNNTAAPTITFKTTATITAACEAIIPVTVDGITINKKFSFAVAKTGSTGATGLKSLQPTRNWNGTFTIIGATVNCTTDDFNRTPVAGDTFTNLDGSSNTGTWKVTAVSGYTVTIQLLSNVSSKGATGIGVKSTAVTYQVSSSGTTAPTGTWSTSVPSVSAGQFLWTRTIITYSNNTTSTLYSVGRNGTNGVNGTNGTNGQNGKSIGQVVNYYLATNASSNVTASTSGWTTTVQSVSSSKKYLWNYEVVKYTDGTTASTTAPCIIGSYGDTGAKGDKGAKGDTGAAGKNATYITVTGSNYNTTTDLMVSCIAINGVRYNYTPGRGHTLVVLNPSNSNVESIKTYDTYVSSALLETALNNVSSGKIICLFTGDACGITSNVRNILANFGSSKTNVWEASRVTHVFVGMKGLAKGNAYEIIESGSSATKSITVYYTSTGIVLNGATGAMGATGVGIKSITEYYAVSTTNTTAPTSWVTSIPTLTASNKYLWNYETVTYTNNSAVSTSKRVIGVYGDKGLKGDTGAKGDKGDTGAAGNGIASTAVAYQAGSSGTTAPTGTWSTSVPVTSAAAPYLWTRITIKYTNGTVTNSYSVGSTPEGISVGGRNMAESTNQGTTGWHWSMQAGGYTASEIVENNIRTCKLLRNSTAQSGWSVIEYSCIGRSKYEANTVYTVSFDVKSNVGTVMHIGLQRGDGTDNLMGSNTAVNRQIKANQWNKLIWIIKTATTLPSSTGQLLYITGMNSGTGVWYQFKNLKIEKGNKATDWSPAPEDIDTKFNNYTTTEQMKHDFKNSSSELYSAINSSFATNGQVSTVDSKFSDYYSRKDASTAIKQINDAISLKASLEEFHNGYRIIEAGGYGNDYRGTGAWLKINNIKQNIATGRGLSVTSINPTTLVANGSWSYDTFGSATARTNFKNKITELNSGDYIIVVVSSDAAYPSTVADALQLIGGTVYTGESYREAYALIGKSRLGYGNGIEMYIPKTAEDKRNAVVSCYVSTAGALMSSNSNSLYKKVTADLELKVGKNDNNQIVSMINASANEINLKANRFSLESDNLIITKDGKITKCKSINVTGGNIGRWNISDYLSSDNKDSDGYIRRAWMQPAANDETWVYSVQKSSNKNDASAFGGLWFVKGNGDQTTQNLNVNKNLTVYSDLTLYGKLTTDLKFRNYGKIINPYNQDLRFYASSEEQYALTFGVEYSASHSVITGWHFGPDAGGHIELGSARHPWYSIHADTSLYVHSGSVYCYDYYYIWSNGGWVELSDWIKAKL